MSAELKLQVFGLQREVEAANEFMGREENSGKSFRASTEVFHSGNPSPLPVDLSMDFIKQGFDDIRSIITK